MFYIKHNNAAVYLNKGPKEFSWRSISNSENPYKFNTAHEGFNFITKNVTNAKPVCIVKHRVAVDGEPDILYELIERLSGDRIKVRAINFPGQPENVFNIEEINDTF